MNGELRRTVILAAFGTVAFGLAYLSYSQGAPQRSLAETLTATPKPAALNPKRFEIADQAFRERRDFNRARASYSSYRELHLKNPTDAEAAWKLSMACYYMGERVLEKAPDSEREKIFAEGRDAGETSLSSTTEKCAPCHFWTAINMALYGRTVGVFKMLFSLTAIRKHLEASIEADPTYAFGGAQRLLGKIYESIPGILGGSDNKARDYYQQAISSAPDEPLNYLFLAGLLRNGFQDKVGAQAVVQKGLQLPTPTPDRVEAVDALAELKRFDSPPQAP